MLFNSGQFFFFFLAVYSLYLLIPKLRWQNVLLLIASYAFYAAWDIRFLSLIVLSTLIDYFTAHRIHLALQQEQKRQAKQWLLISIFTNLSILGFFKYYNFFVESLILFIQTVFGFQVDSLTLNIILPVGISFYTFQTLSYSIDVYRGRQRPTVKLLDFALFVSFFPQLMAGPIERAGQLLPQLQRTRIIKPEQIQLGGWLIFWGVFKKVYIADNLAPYVNWAFYHQGAQTVADVYLAIFAFSLQLYCDFSGYSDIARGLAKLMGIELSRNFNLPFWASNPADLWQRWHITLSNWFRDYVYGPIRNTLPSRRWHSLALIPTMTLVGLWHGAAWKYVVFGLLWGLTLFAYRQLQPLFHRFNRRINMPIVSLTMGILLTFHIWLLFLLFFIANDVQHGWHLWSIVFTDRTWQLYNSYDLNTVLFYSYPLILMQLIQFWRAKQEVLTDLPYIIRLFIYTLLALLLWVYGAKVPIEFIYFQF